MRHRDRETERQRGRETERLSDRETERQRDRETERQRDIETERQMAKVNESLTKKLLKIQKDRKNQLSMKTDMKKDRIKTKEDDSPIE